MILAELIWKPDWILLLAGCVAIVLIWQGIQNRLRIDRLEKKIERLEAESGKRVAGG
jgi:hypothetical protein